MLALRTSMKCNAAVKALTRNTLNSVKLIQINSVAANTTTNLELHRNAGTFNFLQSQPALLNGHLLSRRTYTTKPADDDDTKALERVYYGSLSSRMRAVKVFSLTTSLVGLAAQPKLLEAGVKFGGTGMAIALCGFAGIFTFITPFLLHFITKKYVTELHYNPQTGEYIATTISIILQKHQTKFRPSDVKVPEVPGMFTSFMVGEKALFVDPAEFDDPEHYVRIMGYDKPVDFKLDLTEPPTEATSDSSKPNK